MNNIESLYNTEIENKTKAIEMVFSQANEKLTAIQDKQETITENRPDKNVVDNKE